MAAEALLALSTFPDSETARRISRELVSGRFAACANIISNLESIYVWQEKLETGHEVLVLFKLAAATYPMFERELKARHPYEVPEIITTEIGNGLPDYLRWVVANSTAVA
jgi:periplasmic divalent cation tolerance protein